MRLKKLDLNTLKDTPPWEWPEGIDKMLLKILRDDRAVARDRLLAAELAGDSTVINDELADALLTIAGSGEESDDLRSKAAISLGPTLEQSDIDGFEDPDDVMISQGMFSRIQESLRRLYMDAGVPQKVRRRILEASVRAPEAWHKDAIRAAYFSGDDDWKLTAVFCMRFVSGFDDQILESLGSEDPDIHYEAVCAAGTWAIDGAWPHVVSLVASEDTEKELLLAAIDAVASIRPQEAEEILEDLADSDDEEIVDAVYEALAMAGEPLDDEYEEEDEDDESPR